MDTAPSADNPLSLHPEALVPGSTLDIDLSVLAVMQRPGRGATLLKRGLNYFHEGLADYLLVNPGATLREMGVYFGYTPTWLCQVINSDMFQAYLGTRRAEVSSAVNQSLPEKLKGAAHLATERLADIVATTTDERVAVDAADKILHRYGYAPNSKTGAQSGGPVIGQQNNFFLNANDLAAARQQFVERHDGKVIQGGPGGEGSEVPLLPATVHNSET